MRESHDVARPVGVDQLARVAAHAFARRRTPALALAAESTAIARACHAMARRFAAGGTLIAFGNGTSATDAHHVVVEFLHPVLVGKRPLPALALTADVATVTAIASGQGWDTVFSEQLRCLATPGDIALGLAVDEGSPNVLLGLQTARALDLLTVALTGGVARPLSGHPAVDHHIAVPSTDPAVVKEVQVTAYHLLWELVHVFLEQPGMLTGAPPR